jgi:hypothetical protein
MNVMSANKNKYMSFSIKKFFTPLLLLIFIIPVILTLEFEWIDNKPFMFKILIGLFLGFIFSAYQSYKDGK